MEGNIKHYSCFSPDEQKYYESLSPKKRLYIDFRGQGYDKANAYKAAGFEGGNPSQSAYNMEARDKGLTDLIGILKRDNAVRTIGIQDSKLNNRIDALAKQAKAEEVLAKIDGLDGETAERIKFYRDIASGKVKTKKTIKEFDKFNKLIKVRVEEVEDVSTKIQARRELDRVLGLNQVIDIGKIETGDITINIVDASNKDALQDSRNKVNNEIKIEDETQEIIITQEEK